RRGWAPAGDLLAARRLLARDRPSRRQGDRRRAATAEVPDTSATRARDAQPAAGPGAAAAATADRWARSGRRLAPVGVGSLVVNGSPIDELLGALDELDAEAAMSLLAP